MRVNRQRVVTAVAALGLVAAMFGTISASGAATLPHAGITVKSFTSNFSAMKQLIPITHAGSGAIGVILPDEVSSTRYVEFDAPDIHRAFIVAGLPNADIKIQNALGSDQTQISDAQAMIAAGDKVIIVDPLDAPTGVTIENMAKNAGVKVIDYDRLTLGGSRAYYVSFDNVFVGTLLGRGLVSCTASWKVAHPKAIVMAGAATDNNATLFSQGYNAVLNPLFASHKWVKESAPAGTWTPSVALTEFQQAYTAHRQSNSLLSPNDENAAPIITYLKTLHIKPNTFPVTGQDATLTGLQNMITNYQCGTVYKPIFLEAQGAAALALYLRAGKTPPAGLTNGTVMDTKTHVKVKSVLMTPEWVTPQLLESTIIKDHFVTAKQLCTHAYAARCRVYGIH
ncbi:MAG TPA: substrate-binding domain-containing protein [Acidimicrobiales bacterium]|jgi:D-xylose transport system substrate-binding protein|nr:substrate-binding domain-containing protein [Acidimicrobiales bacterium]